MTELPGWRSEPPRGCLKLPLLRTVEYRPCTMESKTRLPSSKLKLYKICEVKASGESCTLRDPRCVEWRAARGRTVRQLPGRKSEDAARRAVQTVRKERRHDCGCFRALCLVMPHIQDPGSQWQAVLMLSRRGILHSPRASGRGKRLSRFGAGGSCC